jgi:hypothetical protein
MHSAGRVDLGRTEAHNARVAINRDLATSDEVTVSEDRIAEPPHLLTGDGANVVEIVLMQRHRLRWPGDALPLAAVLMT